MRVDVEPIPRSPAGSVDGEATPVRVADTVWEDIQRSGRQIKLIIMRLQNTLNPSLVNSMLKQFRGVAAVG